jgi:hypothetical integral membrane protein (TIGR02206 family)
VERYFQADGEDAFMLFSITHWMTILILVGVIVLIFLFRRFLRKTPFNSIVRIGLAATLIISEISLHAWLWRIEEWTIQYSLPFHLSSISILLSAALLLTRSYSLFEFTYFAGVGSALQAMMTPDISAFTFPHFRYVHFFISHGGIVVANFFMVLVEKYRPTAKSIWKAFLYLNLYTFFVFLLNYFIEGNYMYISEKPVNPSLLDYLGPWPFYNLALEAIAFITFLLLYIPFWLLDRFGKDD